MRKRMIAWSLVIAMAVSLIPDPVRVAAAAMDGQTTQEQQEGYDPENTQETDPDAQVQTTEASEKITEAPEETTEQPGTEEVTQAETTEEGTSGKEKRETQIWNQTVDGTAPEVQTAIPEQTTVGINATDLTLYVLEDWERKLISIPADCAIQYQLQVNGSAQVSYKVIQGSTVNVTASGLVTPRYTTWYQYDGYSSTYDNGNAKSSYQRPNCGTSVIQVTAGGQSFRVNVTVKDYGDLYTEQQLNAFISRSITADMTLEQKLKAIAAYVGNEHDYDAQYSSAKGMIISGGGDCWASCAVITALCEKLSISAWVRNGNKDPFAGSGHRNVLVDAGNGTYYEVEAGYSGSKPRGYSIEKRDSLFCVRNIGSDDTTVKVYQYDGKDGASVLEIPAQINGKTVVAVDDKFSSGSGGTGSVTEIRLPDTIQTIGQFAFSGYSGVTTLRIPASVTKIGTGAFTTMNLGNGFSCDAANPNYAVKDGVLYNKDMSMLIQAPAKESVTIPASVREIGTYAFYFNTGLTSVTIPATVTKLGVAAFACCSELRSVKIEDGGLTELPEYAFYQSGQLKHILIPASVKTMGDKLFSNASLTIYGSAGSTAQQYATANGYAFRQAALFDQEVAKGKDSGSADKDTNGGNSGSSNASTGQLVTRNNQTYYYVNGRPVTNQKIRIGNSYYYFAANGVMVKNRLIRIGRYYYYCASNGVILQNKLQRIGRYYYYFASNGVMAQNRAQRIGRYTYYFAGNGVMISNRLQRVGRYYYYFAGNGVMVSGRLVRIGRYYYYAASNGVILQNRMQRIGRYTYYFAGNGVMVQNRLVRIGRYYYYFDAYGRMRTGWVRIGRYYYYFNNRGIFVKRR